jgi:cytochrome c biogenesis protein CcdA/thiol-disulfide isomerase/thioredoxin
MQWEAGPMPVLIIIGFLGGLATGISPCIIPVVPVLFAAGTAPGGQADRHHPGRSLAVVGGLVVSFSAFTLIGTSLLSLLGLPQDFLRDVGLAVLGVVALGLIVPPIGDILERPFVRLARGRQHTEGGGLVLGLSLGLLFVPCAGPVLAAITVTSANHRIGLSAVTLTVAFALGVAVPLLAFAMAGQRLVGRMKFVRTRTALVRKGVGVVLLVTALAIGFNLTSGLQRALPGYTDALQSHIESNSAAKTALGGVTGETGKGALAACADAYPTLEDCGSAPAFTGIDGWLNTPNGRPLSIVGLKGKVVLVDFWTYSCINCQRTLPHLEAWIRAYGAAGLTIVGVHTPEFAFEHVISNVTQAAQQLGVTYPIAIDDGYSTWNAYQNQYWPAEYLIDATGTIRHVDFGEGQYNQTEGFIRQLLRAADPAVRLPTATNVANSTPTEPTTPESYLGFQHAQNLAGQSIQQDQMAPYGAPTSIPQDEYAYDGNWAIGSESSTAGSGASIELRYQAKDVYLVLGGTGTVSVSVNGTITKSVVISGEPKLYQLIGASSSQGALLLLSVTPGVAAYDFTFG